LTKAGNSILVQRLANRPANRSSAGDASDGHRETTLFDPRILSGVTEMADRDDLIRERAYQIWQERGQPEGCADDHWLAAEQELADEADKSKESAKGAAAK
jgi:hypothetical protein